MGIQELTANNKNENGFKTTATCQSTDGAELYSMDKDTFIGLLGKQQATWQALTEKGKQF